MTKATHAIHLAITEVAEKHGVVYELDTESRTILINFVKSVSYMGDEGVEMLIVAFLVGYEKGGKNGRQNHE